MVNALRSLEEVASRAPVFSLKALLLYTLSEVDDGYMIGWL